MWLVVTFWLFAFVLYGCAGTTATPTLLPIQPDTVIPRTTPPLAAPAQAGIPNPTSAPAGSDTATPSATAAPQLFDGNHAYNEYLQAQMALGPRPAGSVADRATGDYILNQLAASGWETATQEFMYHGIPIRNVIGKIGAGQGPLVVLGAHYDTRPRANMDKVNPQGPVPGADDGASGVAVLLELARTLGKSKLKNEVWLAFFDAEDNGDLTTCDLHIVPMQIRGDACDGATWPFSVGADYVAAHLPSTPAAVIVVDMVGDKNQNIYYEQNSNQDLNQQIWGVAGKLGYSQWLIPQNRWSMTDDHTPFLQRQMRAIDMIDFDYPPWHTTQDTADKVNAASLEHVGRTLQAWLEGGEIQP